MAAKLTETEMIAEYGVSPYETTEKCDSCGKPFEFGVLVATLDGPFCVACMVEYGNV